MDDKIIQIIPAPFPIWAKWKPVDDEDKEEFSPVICFALKEYQNGRFIVPMSISEDGEISDVFEFENFGGIVFSKNPIKN